MEMTNRRSEVTRLFSPLLTASAVGASVAVAVPSAYLALLTAAAIPRTRTTPSERADRQRFAVCIPAHNEAAVIAATVHALVGQRYPSEAYEVHVVADNCSDDTAAVARAAGATVHIRTDLADPGKGPALNWLFARLDGNGDDGVVFIDADTVADEGFLAGMADAFDRGAQVAQGHYATLDPDRSPTVAFRYAALACRHHLRPLGRNRLGASCGLYGNGMAFRPEIMRQQPWTGHLVEDAEMQSALLFEGIAITYVPAAVVRAEMPDTLEASETQHQRWEIGRMQLIRRFVPPLLQRLIAGGPHRRRVYVDAALDHLTPPLSVLVMLQSVVGLFGAVGWVMGDRPRSNRVILTSVLSGGAVVAHVLVALRLVKAPASVYRSLLGTPRMVLWKISMLKKARGRVDSMVWTRTKRNA
jgi:cellulose synthase/poly-beta-1,6-N-acetylglucosamine synthase-like glycosyltransferase